MSWVDDALYQSVLRDIDDGTERLLWGRHTDRGFARVAETFSGVHAYTIPPGTTTYSPVSGDIDSASAVAHRSSVVLSGAMTVAMDYVLPQRSGRWFFRNATTDGGGGPYAVTVKMATGATVVLKHGERAIIQSNGTDLTAFSSDGSTLARMAAAAVEADVYSSMPSLGNMIDVFIGMTGGTATAITATASVLFDSALPDPCRLTGVWGTSSSGAATTISINGLTAYPLYARGVDPALGVFYAGELFQALYTSSAFHIINPRFNIIPTGLISWYVGLTAPDGWVLMNDGTIGSAASNATNRAHADCRLLFSQLWYTAQGNANFTIYDSAGVASTYSTEAADWAANKAITVPKVLGRAIVGAGAGFGLTSRSLGDLFGAETTVHNHGVGTGGANFGGDFQAIVAINNATISTFQPSVALPLIIKL